MNPKIKNNINNLNNLNRQTEVDSSPFLHFA